MNPESALSTIAEVAIAIAGFGGVVAAIVSVTPKGLSEASRVLFSGLFTASITIISLSIAPQILSSASLDEADIWRFSSGLHAAYLVALSLRRVQQLWRAGESVRAVGSVLPIALLIAGAQIANGIWFQTAWLYLAALLAHVSLAFSLFPRLLAEMWSGSTET